jgi:hypothetical protein
VTQVSITVDDSHLDAISQVVAALRARGLHVDQVLDELGIITGSVPQGQHDALRSVDGVVSVEQGQHFRLPPPDSPVQ